MQFEDDLEAVMVMTSLAPHVNAQHALALFVSFAYHNSFAHITCITSLDQKRFAYQN